MKRVSARPRANQLVGMFGSDLTIGQFLGGVGHVLELSGPSGPPGCFAFRYSALGAHHRLDITTVVVEIIHHRGDPNLQRIQCTTDPTNTNRHITQISTAQTLGLETVQLVSGSTR